jgi:DNA-binding MarR family transcriptional regulator
MTHAAQPNAKPDASHAAPDRQRLRLWLKMLRTSRGIEAELRRRLRRNFSVTLPHFDVMAALARAPAGMTMTELSRFLVISNGNVTSIIDAMVAGGSVMRVPSAEDRRATFVRLTPAGVRDFATMATAHNAWIEDLLGGLAADQVELATQLLDTLHTSLARGDTLTMSTPK